METFKYWGTRSRRFEARYSSTSNVHNGLDRYEYSFFAHTKFIHTKNELGYQEVTGHFSSAEKIAILTYNISEKK